MITHKQILFVSILTVTALGILGAVTAVNGPRRTATALQKSATVEGNNQFTFRLLARLAAKSPTTENLFLSPFSIQQAVLLTANGAAGDTRKEILHSLQLPTEIGVVNQDEKAIGSLLTASPYEIGMGYIRPAYQWRQANAIWTQGKPGVEFQKDCQHFYKAEAHPLTSVQVINDWSKQKTGGLLPHVLDNIPALTDVLLTNAVYFKGQWVHEFKSEDRQADAVFHPSGNRKGYTLPRMNQEGFDIPFYHGNGYEAVSLPYRGGVRMVVILPDNKELSSIRSKDPISDFESRYAPSCFQKMQSSSSSITANELAARFTLTQWNQLKAELKPGRVWVSIPRFELEYDVSLLGDLTAMGMPIHGDFRPMAKKVDHIDLLVHHTFLRVDEKGTEAAAVTVHGAGACSASLNCPHPFIVDHPFLCVIEHEATGTILFAGVINSPKAAK